MACPIVKKNISRKSLCRVVWSEYKSKKFFDFGIGHINPELIDPDDYHQDRPSFKATQIYGNSPKDYYPLGKPPPSKQVTPDILGKVRYQFLN